MSPFGSVLNCELDDCVARKARGAFFTPRALADFLTSWSIRSKTDMVLEPACGEAEFLISAGRRIASLGASFDKVSEQIVGCELHKASAAAALLRCNENGLNPVIRTGDFLAFRSKEKFDVVVGNPPYVRFQLIDGKQKKSIRDVCKKNGLAVNAMASAWAPFVIHACSFLKKGGRLAFVLPAELLTVNYAAPIREFLLESFRGITLLTFESRVFPEVQEEVVLLLAEGYNCGKSDCIVWRECKNVECIEDGGERIFSPGDSGMRWTAGLANADSTKYLDELLGGCFVELADWGHISLGAVTGANKFFALSKEEVEKWNLDAADVVRLSPPGSAHLRSLSFDDTLIKSLDRRDAKTYLFYPDKKLSSEARGYIEYGEHLGIDERYKCRKRSPWWRVPVGEAPDAFFTYMNDYAPNLCSNFARVYCLNSVHGIRFAEGKREQGMSALPLACINSATLLSSELVGRSYGGGLLKLEPREARRLSVPSFLAVEKISDSLLAFRDEASRLLDDGDIISVRDRVDEFLCKAGFFDVQKIEALRKDKERLYIRRKARGRGVNIDG